MERPEVQWGGRAHVQVREYGRGKPACAETNPLDEFLARDPEARVPPVQQRGSAGRRPRAARAR
eukprot:13850861-Alexandrium_andersonii.AAC.1